jgi:hypothetical protein
MKPELEAFVRERNALPYEVWIKQPFSVRVALEILDPDKRFVTDPGLHVETLAEAVVEEFMTPKGSVRER